MAPTLLLTFCVTLVAVTQAAHQVSFTGGSRTLPQKEREVAPKIRALQHLLSAMERRDAEKRAASGDCDAACLERRALELLPTARRFLSSLSEKVARGLKERREEGMARAVRGITDALGEASKKRAVSAFGSPLAAVMKEEMERGIIKEGLSSNDRPARSEVAEKGLKAAMSLRSMVEKRALDKRAQADEMREVSALITDLESQSQKRALEAERLGERAVGDLQDAMKLERRADHVRHFVQKEKAKRAVAKLDAFNKRVLEAKRTEDLKRGMTEIKAISEDLQRRELENQESKRDAIFGNLKSLATRALQEKLDFVRKSTSTGDLQKKEFSGMRIAEEIAQAKRSLDEQKLEKVRELVQMKIADEIAQAKRSLDEHKYEKVRNLAQMKIAEGVATAKRAFEKREFAENERRAQKVRELAQMKIAEGVATAKRAFEKREFAENERRAQKVRELAQMKIAEGVAKAKRAFEKREFAENEEKARSLAKIAEGVAKAKRAFEKREFHEKQEQVRKIAEGVDKVKRAFAEHALEQRSMAEKRFAYSIDTLKRFAQEDKSTRALETLDSYKRAMDGQNKHLQAARALEGLKTALEKRELGVRALKEVESVRAVRNIGQALEKALSTRALEASKREQDLRELEALLSDE